MKFFEEKPMLLMVLLIVIGTGLGIFQYYPVHVQKRALKKTLSKQTTTMDEIKSHCVQLPILHRQVLDLQVKASEYNQCFPPNQQFAQLWQQIAQIMDKNQLQDQLVRPGEVVCDDQLCAIPLDIECSGTFEQLFQFFRCMEDFERLIRMEDISIRNSTDLSGIVTLNAKARVYYQPADMNKT